MLNFDKKIMVTGCVLMAVTIGIGAFAAHGLEKLVSSDAIASFETGVRYQMYHSLALLILAIVAVDRPKLARSTFIIFLFAMLLFSGSIYILALKELIGDGVSVLGPVTPIGGLLFIFGWLRLAVGLLTKNRG